ncbi:MAG: Crp/Fnr family transcriptional regulator [Rhodanobacteraceae bacterium]
MSTPVSTPPRATANISSTKEVWGASGNRLLDALPRADRARIVRACKAVDLRLGDVLHEPGQRMRYAWFPLSGCVSLLTPSEHRSEQQIYLVGNEGMLGTVLVLGVEESYQRALVLDTGKALRIYAPALRRELKLSESLRRKLHRYVHVLMTQLVQNAVCLASHKVEQRLAHWLLMIHVRASVEPLTITQSALAELLGVRRVGVSAAASALQRRGLIRYSRGRLVVTDRPALVRAACGCYHANRISQQRWLG